MNSLHASNECLCFDRLYISCQTLRSSLRPTLCLKHCAGFKQVKTKYHHARARNHTKRYRSVLQHTQETH